MSTQLEVGDCDDWDLVHVQTNGTLSIPAGMRERYGFSPGDKVVVKDKGDGRIELRRA